MLTISSADKDPEQLELSYVSGGDANSTPTLFIIIKNWKQCKCPPAGE